MANNIETHVRDELRELERTVTALQKLGDITANLQPGDMPSFGFLSYYLGERLQEQFQAFHVTVSQQLLPFVAGIKAEKLQ
ncbi:hypothetical protein [Herbaspirillum huttiense]|jgi:hypothetical protein|uniref:Uncharacterized protein n=2 Tax=Herbaspirillum huttiense TaxID=863372 RepID=A0AAJ2HGE8_9BURK|nr:hypothetical protein [Herbaspirillum huttiense]MDR9839876.1 hypothetical protein [Herbaspirillum huttiense]